MSLASRIEQISLRARSEPRGLPASAPMQQELFPDWSDELRRAPNLMLRSALFSAIGRGRRAYVERRSIQAISGIYIVYTGTQLDQGDLDVLLALTHAARGHALGAECQVTGYRLLMLLGKTDSGRNRQILDRHLSRMMATALEVRVGSRSYEGSLIDEVYRDQTTRAYVIRLNPRLRPLFVDDQFTDLDWSTRRALNGKPLAQWLHGFYASHAAPHSMRVETLHRLCGSGAAHLADFRKDLRRALGFLVDAGGRNGRPFNFEIVGDLVNVRTTPSASQRRHLARGR